MAGALGLALAGPRVYGGVHGRRRVDGRWAARGERAADIRAALDLYARADGLLIALVGALVARHRASLSSRSRSICAARCAASRSSVASTSAS